MSLYQATKQAVVTGLTTPTVTEVLRFIFLGVITGGLMLAASGLIAGNATPKPEVGLLAAGLAAVAEMWRRAHWARLVWMALATASAAAIYYDLGWPWLTQTGCVTSLLLFGLSFAAAGYKEAFDNIPED